MKHHGVDVDILLLFVDVNSVIILV
jgi:hypothetical protein